MVGGGVIYGKGKERQKEKVPSSADREIGLEKKKKSNEKKERRKSR